MRWKFEGQNENQKTIILFSKALFRISISEQIN